MDTATVTLDTSHTAHGLLCGPEWDALVVAVCAESDVDEATERLLAA